MLPFALVPDVRPKTKNPTPSAISAYASLLAAAIVGAVLLGVAYAAELPWWTALLGAVVTGVASYLIFLSYLRRYIYRKIKLVYKTIHQHKLTPEEKSNAVDVHTDILQQVQEDVETWMEEQNRQLAQLRKFEEYRQRFLGDISHELKTPIFNIQGYLETLLDGAIDDEAIRRPYVEKAARNVDRLNTIVEDLESITRLEDGKAILDMQAFGIRDLAQEVFEELQLKADARGITLDFKAGAATDFQVMADRENIRQVLINLVNNSIKYGRPGGHTKLAFYDMADAVLTEVADNGIGISEHHLPRIFERFYRVDKSRSREAGGSGLGLSIVKHIVEAHEQTLNVRSSKELGSTFGFTLKKA